MATKTSLNYAKLASKMLEEITTEQRDGRKMYFAKREGNPVSEFVIALANESHSLDYTYEFTVEMLNVLADSEALTEEEAHEVINERVEPDIYTSDLTAWLNASNEHIAWVDEAGESYNAMGFQAVMIGQQLAKENIGHLLVDWITDNFKQIK